MARSRGSLTSSGLGFRTQTREPAERTCCPVSATSSLWESGQVPNLSEPRFLSATCGHHLPQRQLAREHTVDIRRRVVTYLRGSEAPEGGDDTGGSHQDIPGLQPRHRLAGLWPGVSLTHGPGTCPGMLLRKGPETPTEPRFLTVTKRGHPTAIGVTSTDLCPTLPRLSRPT